MAYIGKQPGTGVRNRFLYTATAGQTTFTTSDSNLALSYSDALYMDVYLNGVLLDPANDYTATSGTSVVLGSGATAGDVLEIVVYDVFSVFNNTIDGNFDVGGDLTVDTNTLHVDSTNNDVGIGTASPTGATTTTLHINGTTNAGIHITDSASGATDSDGVYLSMDSPNLYFQNKEAGFTAFETSGTERMRILAGGGLTFNGDTAAANALDDYEEGTWTPAYTGGSSAPTVTHTNQIGRYVKVGQIVSASFRINTNGVSGGSGAAFITGLPYASESVSSMFSSLLIGYSASFAGNAPQSGFLTAGGTSIQLLTNSATSARSQLASSVAISDLNTASGATYNDVIGHITYRTA